MLKYTICFIRNGDSLLMLNRNKAPLFGMWNGVGGKIEPGETPYAGILRELREETGLELSASDVRFSGVVTWEVDGRDEGGMYAFIAELPAGMDVNAPCDTEEGILAWKRLDWIVDPNNRGVAAHVPHFLPIMLDTAACREHRCEFREGRFERCRLLPLPDRLNADAIEASLRTSAAEGGTAGRR